MARSADFALSWSGGKDSSLALWALQQEDGGTPRALITTVTEGYDRISMHGVRRSLLAMQAISIGIPLVEVLIPPDCTNEVYENRMNEALASPPLRDIRHVAFGDLFLEDVRAYRETRMAAAGKSPLFPLWHRDTTQLARDFVDAGFEAIIVCVDPQQLDGDFCGRRFDHHLLDQLPDSVDPCGERGEFHTFVHACPVFATPLPITVGETVERSGFVYADVLPAVTEPSSEVTR